jgi:hypothetical protein
MAICRSGSGASLTHVPGADPIFYHARFVVPDGYPRAAADAFMRFQLRRPQVWIQVVLLLVVVPVLVIEIDHSQFNFLIAIGLDVAIIVGTVVSWVTRRQNLIGRLGRTGAPGTTRELSLAGSTVSMRTADSFAESPYRSYESADSFGGFVFLRLRGTSSRSILPRELFTDDSLAFLRSKIKEADAGR